MREESLLMRNTALNKEGYRAHAIGQPELILRWGNKVKRKILPYSAPLEIVLLLPPW